MTFAGCHGTVTNMDDHLVQQTLAGLGATLRDARLKGFLTQSDVSQLAGVSRQLVSRIEQGCNGEISAYIAVAAALQHKFAIVREPALKRNTPAGLDLGNTPPPQLDG